MNFESFLAALFSLLKKRHLCFDRGSLVLRIPHHAVSQCKQMIKQSGVKRHGQTHRVFLSNTQYSKHSKCGRLCRVKGLTSQYDTRLYGHIQCQKTKKRIALAYMFTINQTPYMFVKLESHPAMSLGHSREAIMRYGFGQTVRTDIYPRRENSYKNGTQIPGHILKRDRSAWRHPEAYSEANRYDTHFRVGSELYVPREIVNALLSQRSILLIDRKSVV